MKKADLCKRKESLQSTFLDPNLEVICVCSLVYMSAVGQALWPKL